MTSKTKLTRMIEDGEYVNSKMESIEELEPVFAQLKDETDDSEEFGMRVLKIKDVVYGIRASEKQGNLWSITADRGKLPEELKGRYTTADRARAAIEQYVTAQEFLGAKATGVQQST